MANTTIALRQSGATGNTPSLGVLANGELSLNYADSILYFKTVSNTLGSIRTTQPAGLTTEIQFNDAGSFGTNSAFNFNKTTGTLNVRNIIVSTNLTANTIITGSGAGGIIAGANVIYSNIFVANSTTTSISNSTGAIISNGGLGVKGNVYADAVYDGGVEVILFANQAFTQANSANVLAQAAFNKANSDLANTGTSVTANSLTQYIFANTTASTSKTTGALTVAGGVGVAGNVSTLGVNVDNRVDWPASGTGAPTFTTRSSGTKLLLYPAISGSQVDYAMGIDSATLWSSVPVNSSSFYFKWYGGTTNVTSLDGTGAFTTTTINVYSTTASTSNLTGALIVAGGIGVKGNVSANGIIFDDGTRQTTAASAGGASLADVLALSIALG
jgi:hypothetical protein